MNNETQPKRSYCRYNDFRLACKHLEYAIVLGEQHGLEPAIAHMKIWTNWEDDEIADAFQRLQAAIIERKLLCSNLSNLQKEIERTSGSFSGIHAEQLASQHLSTHPKPTVNPDVSNLALHSDVPIPGFVSEAASQLTADMKHRNRTALADEVVDKMAAFEWTVKGVQTYLPLTKWKDLDAETQNNIMDCVIADYTKGHVFLFLHDRDVDHIVLKSELRLICDYTDLYDS